MFPESLHWANDITSLSIEMRIWKVDGFFFLGLLSCKRTYGQEICYRLALDGVRLTALETIFWCCNAEKNQNHAVIVLTQISNYYIFWAYYAKIKVYGENSKVWRRKEDKRMISNKRDGLIYKSNKYIVGKCEYGDKSFCRKLWQHEELTLIFWDISQSANQQML